MKKLFALPIALVVIVLVYAGAMTPADAAGQIQIKPSCGSVTVAATGAPFIEFEVFVDDASGARQTIVFHPDHQTDPSLVWWSDSRDLTISPGGVTVAWVEYDGGNNVAMTSGPTFYEVADCHPKPSSTMATTTSELAADITPPSSDSVVTATTAAAATSSVVNPPSTIAVTQTAPDSGPPATLPLTGKSTIGWCVLGVVILILGICGVAGSHVGRPR